MEAVFNDSTNDRKRNRMEPGLVISSIRIIVSFFQNIRYFVHQKRIWSTTKRVKLNHLNIAGKFRHLQSHLYYAIRIRPLETWGDYAFYECSGLT